MFVSGNANTGNLGTATIIATTANLTTINSGLVQNGTSNVTINNNGNVNISVGGNVLTVTSTGANITGTANISSTLAVTGNANVGNLGTATAIITTANITTINGSLHQNGNSNITITANSNVTITATSNATMVVTGTGANVTGYANITGNLIVGANANITGTANITGNANVGNLGATGLIAATGNVSGGNITTIGQLVSTVATGTAPLIVYSTTQVANLSAATAGAVANGTSNVSIPVTNGNVNIVSAGNTTVVVTGTGANIAGTANVTGNLAVGGNITDAGNIAVNGGTVTTTATTFNLLTANATTLNIGNAATTLNIGSSSGNVVVAGDMQITGNDIRSSTGNSAITLNDIDVTIHGNLTIQGSQTNVGTNDLVVQDSIINLHTAPNLEPLTTNDGRDIGLKMHYYSSSDKHAFLGRANDTGYLEFYSDGTETAGVFSGTYGTFKGSTFLSVVTTGTAPLTVTSTTQVANLNVAVAGSIVNGSSNITIPSAGGNATVSVGGNANILVVTGTGANISGTANISGNANIGNIGTGGILSVSGNANVGNLGTTGLITASGNVSGGNLTTTGVVAAPSMVNGNSNVSIAPNGNVSISAVGTANVLTIAQQGANISGYANISANANVGNLGTSGTVIASTLQSNVTTGTPPFTVTSTTQVANLNVATAGNLVNGTSNVIVTNNGNITVGSAGNAAVFTVTGSGANITGTANVSGNANIGNIGTGTIIATTANLTTINGALHQNGTSNVTINNNGNVNISVGGNVLTVTSTGANITGTANVTSDANVGGNINVTGNANIANININNVTITSTSTNGNLNLDANGTGKIVLNSSADDSNVIIQGNSASGWANLIYADAVNGRVGILTNTVPANAIAKFNATSSIIVPVGSTAQRPSVGTSLSGMIRFNTTTNNLEFFDGTNWTGSGSSFTVITADQFAGDGSTVAFTLSQNATSAGLLVMVNGIVQLPTTSYNVSGNTLTFTEAPQPGDVIDSRVIATTSTVSALGVGDTSVTITDTGSNGNLVVVADGNTRLYVNNSAVGINAPVVTTIANVSVGTSATTIDQWPIASYRSAKYKIQVSHASAGYEVSEVLVVHDGTTASRTAYGIIYTGAASLGSTSVTISTGNVLVQYTGANTSNTVRISAEYLPI